MKKSDFYYDLPPQLIAQTPIEPRDNARLLVYDKKTGEICDRIFKDVTDYLNEGDVLVVNNTKVIPARLYGNKATGANVEFLLHKRLSYTDWEVLCKPAKRAKEGDVFKFSDALSAVVLSAGEDGARNIRFSFDGVFEDILSQTGEMPLPHYIHEGLKDKSRYQTVYAKTDGSSAAPTAGLHFTDELLNRVKAKGVSVASVLLHVGLGTFRPVKSDEIEGHKMHSEYYEITKECADIINKARKNGKKVVVVGTTSVRVLESADEKDGEILPSSGYTQIFIYPPYRFKFVDTLITNFHLPESTLIMLVSAFVGRENAMRVYEHAVENEYRFFSFGDACIFL